MDVEEVKANKQYTIELLVKMNWRMYEDYLRFSPEPALFELFFIGISYHNLKVM